MLGIPISTPRATSVRFIDVLTYRSADCLHAIVAGTKKEGAHNVDCKVNTDFKFLNGITVVRMNNRDVAAIYLTAGLEDKDGEEGDISN